MGWSLSKPTRPKTHYIKQCIAVFQHHPVVWRPGSERSDEGTGRKRKTNGRDIQHTVPVEIHQQAQATVGILKRLHRAFLIQGAELLDNR
jgi:hypothetical protein